ncbi:MAG: archaellin/type IV pilin N-terminal domain-containing protein [Candidatus Bathyarchaeia archaeon]
MKLFKSRKALSPVVASIILIAVTVAVSIAVAAWMGALTFTFTATEELKITSVTFKGTEGDKQIEIRVINSGSTSVTLAEEVFVGNERKTGDDVDIVYDGENVKTLEPGKGATVTVNYSWVEGRSYQVKLLTTKGNTFSYVATAPT